jgi:hypothetical protein
MWFLISCFLALAALFRGDHGAAISQASLTVVRDSHAPTYAHPDSGSGPVGSGIR